ncbi:MAG: hypothetical protein IIU58_06750, partial [Clostridia bacterium]|nr:hypothetical protein [Clostridia bacterium]
DNRGDVTDGTLQALDFSTRGTRLKKNLPLAKLFPIRDTLIGTEFYTLGSYVTYLLTKKNCTHATDACASGLFTIGSFARSCPLIPGLLLPTVSESVCHCGTYKGIAVYSPMGDHAVSYLGSFADADTYLLNIGTATQLAFLGEGVLPAATWECRPYFDPSIRLLTLSGFFSGGGCLEDPCQKEKLCTDLLTVLDSVPFRKKLLLGGGGATRIYERLCEVLRDRGIECCMSNTNIGLEGLKMVAETRKASVGIMLSEVAFTNMPLIMKNTGLDFMIVDNEHGSFDYTDLTKMFTVSRLAAFTTIVRLPDNGRAWITKCVDAGADGFLLPMTNCAADIEAVVNYAKYAPIGKRGISTMRAHTLYNPPALDKYMPDANAHIKVYAQIETRAGVENIEEILAVNGVDGVFVGPNDLSCDLGCIGDLAPVLAAMQKVADAAKQAGKPWGLITTSKTLLEKAEEWGVEMISYGSELHMLQNECKKIRGMF